MLVWLLVALAAVAPSAAHLRDSASRAAQTGEGACPLSVRVDRKVDFKTDVRPIFEAKCQPCHFPGGKMYDKLPFDRPETIVKLNEKLFTRIKDEPSRATIRRFLTQK